MRSLEIMPNFSNSLGAAGTTVGFKNHTKLVKVTFADPADFDCRLDREFNPVNCCAVGWLIEKTKHCIKLAWLQDEIDGPSAGLAIPIGCAISVEHISGGRK